MWLALETSGDRASVALGRPGEVLDEEGMQGARRHASSLLPMIGRLLERNGTGLDGLEAIAVSDGPGSFTGLRVGASVAKALAHARRLPLWTAPSLLVLAAELAGDPAAPPGVPVAALGDALRGEAYAGVYRFGGEAVETLSPAVVHRPGELPGLVPPGARWVGALPAAVVEELRAAGGGPVEPPPAGGPRAGALLVLAALRGGVRPVPDPEAWEPEYGRPAEAQARWERAHGRSLPDSSGAAR